MPKWFEAENEFTHEEMMINPDSLCAIYKQNRFRADHPHEYQIIGSMPNDDTLTLGSYTTAERRDERYERLRIRLTNEGAFAEVIGNIYDDPELVKEVKS